MEAGVLGPPVYLDRDHTALARSGTSLTLLVAALAFSYLDRQTLSSLFEPLKADLGLSDSQLGVLVGSNPGSNPNN